MSGLFDYLALDGPEYAYLGHFRDMEYICEGHNDLALEDQIDAGQIPNLHAAGENLPAIQEPGNIAAGAQSPSQPNVPSPTGQAPQQSLGGQLGSAALGTAVDYAKGNQAQDFSSGSDEEASSSLTGTLGQNLAAGGGVGSQLATLFGI